MTIFLSQYVWILGAIILGIVLLQGLVGLVEIVRRFANSESQRRLNLELLHHRIEAAKEHRIEEEQSALSWNGTRKFTVQRKLDEGGNICSFHLSPHDQKSIPSFKPGQYLTFVLHIPNQSKPIIRCYSLSEAPMTESYRVSIKRIPPPRDQPDLDPGLVSNFFHDHVLEGDILDVRAPSGRFFLDMHSTRPIVLIGGGVGITPVLSMLNSLVQAKSDREIWFFYGVMNRNDHILHDHLEQIGKTHENIHVQVCYSNPQEQDVKGRDYHHAERVSVDLFRRVLPSNNYDYYICGPPPMMASLVRDLETWGVPESRVHFETFGPASVKKTHEIKIPDTPAQGAPAIEIAFERSGKKYDWPSESESILDFAEDQGIVIDSGCRAGNCGTCMTAIKSGEVEYNTEPGFEVEAGSCLTCICVPKGPLVLDA